MIPAPVLAWLLELADPSPRYLVLRGPLGRPADDVEVVAAREAIVCHPPARRSLDAQYPAGYWIKPDRGYSPKYKATVWQLLFLADLGAPRTEAIARGCEHVLATALRRGQRLFSAHEHSTGIYPCLNGNLLRALCHFGYGADSRVIGVAEALARRVAELGWGCPRNSTQVRDPRTWQPCAWGCVKVLRGLVAMPEEVRGTAIEGAIEAGTQFLLRRDLAQDQRPALVKGPSHWLRFGFPLGEESDLLEALLALREAGVTRLPAEAVRLVAEKRDGAGRWALERALPNTWADFGVEGSPSKWVTLRAYQALCDGPVHSAHGPFLGTCGALKERVRHRSVG
jgi:hypothetical protein